MPGKKNIKQRGETSNEKKKEKILPLQDIDTSSPSPGSMSEGNLSNNPYGRVRRRTPHAKTFITGTDDDGQAD
jgi:hypothetical protein